MKNIILVTLAFCLFGFAPARADEYKMDDAAMKQMMERSMPGDQHKVLDGLAGSWDYTVSFKMAPDAPEQTSTGTSENKWVLDGRFIQQTVSGTMDMGQGPQKFEGVGYVGHDNVKGKYVSTWMDNMVTGIMVADGTYNPTTKTIKESGQFFCPMKNAEVQFESELTFVDATHVTYAMYDTSAPEKFKAMEIKYTKK